jgi:hypothetical protein
VIAQAKEQDWTGIEMSGEMVAVATENGADTVCVAVGAVNAAVNVDAGSGMVVKCGAWV